MVITFIPLDTRDSTGKQASSLLNSCQYPPCINIKIGASDEKTVFNSLIIIIHQ